MDRFDWRFPIDRYFLFAGLRIRPIRPHRHPKNWFRSSHPQPHPGIPRRMPEWQIRSLPKCSGLRIYGRGRDGTGGGNIQSLTLGDGNDRSTGTSEGNGGLGNIQLHTRPGILRKLKLGALNFSGTGFEINHKGRSTLELFGFHHHRTEIQIDLDLGTTWFLLQIGNLEIFGIEGFLLKGSNLYSCSGLKRNNRSV